MSRWKDFWIEVKARRAGRRGIDSSIHRATRDVTGPTGWVFSGAWDKLDQHGDAYVKSFDRRIPPSIFVSERDRLRHHQPMPLVERCIEDHGAPDRPASRADIDIAALLDADETSVSRKPAAPPEPTQQSAE